MAKRREANMITPNSEAMTRPQSLATFDQAQETLALLKILMLGGKQIDAGRTKSVRAAVKLIRERHLRRWAFE
jgi:hypothetical protein